MESVKPRLRSGHPPPETTQVRRTGDWSSGSKLCSIVNGWWTDPYFQRLNAEETENVPNRTSLICLGYYVRFCVCDFYLRSLVSSAKEPIQIVSLGCGLDSLYFRLLEKHSGDVTRFFDLDYQSVIERKREIIQRDPVLQELSSKLFLVSADLRYMDTSVEKGLESAGFDFQAPTVFYSECVVNYLNPAESEDILRWIGQRVPNSVFVAYEQTSPDDSFGRVMTKHFERNGCPIRSVHENGSLEKQRQQLAKHGFQLCSAINAWDAFCEISKSKCTSIPNLESSLFDEFEALVATCLHYSIRIGISSDMICKLDEPGPLLFNKSLTVKPCLPVSASILRVDNQRVFTCKSELKVKGQASLVIDNKLYVIGGSNQGSIIQERIMQIRCSLTDARFQLTEEVIGQSPLLGRSYGTAVYAESRRCIFLMGGRRSPKCPVEGDMVSISNLTAPGSRPVNVTCHKMADGGGGTTPFPRWRFDATVFTDGLQRHQLFVFGGKNLKSFEEASAESSVWERLLDDVANVGWSPKAFSEDIPSKRHSHSVCACASRDSIFVVGGIYLGGVALCEDALWEYRPNDRHGGQWTRWREFENCGRKVGHRVVFHGNLLHVIGGYGYDSDFGLQTFITTIDLDMKVVRNFEMELLPSQLFLPFEFSAHVIGPEGSEGEWLVVLGGGGNCFSFGSHYNTDSFLFKLPLHFE